MHVAKHLLHSPGHIAFATSEVDMQCSEAYQWVLKHDDSCIALHGSEALLCSCAIESDISLHCFNNICVEVIGIDPACAFNLQSISDGPQS